MKLTPLFIVRESVSVEVCCCSCCISSFCACICFQKFAHYLMRSMRGTHTHTNIYFSLCVKNKKIRHVLDIFVIACSGSWVAVVVVCFIIWRYFRSAFTPKTILLSNFSWLAAVLAKLLHTFSLCLSLLAYTHTQTKSGMHKLWALPSKQKTNKSSLWAHILTLSFSLSDCLSASQISELTTADDVALLDSIFYYYSSATAAAAATRTTTRSYFNALFSHKVQRQWW